MCKNMTTITAVEAAGELSFFTVVNERECARSSEWLNGHTSPPRFTKFTFNSTLCFFSTVNELSECGKRGMERERGVALCVFDLVLFLEQHVLKENI